MGKFAPSSIVPASLRQRYDLQRRFRNGFSVVRKIGRGSPPPGASQQQSRDRPGDVAPNADDNRAALDSLYAKLAAANIALQKVFPVTPQRIDPSAGPRRAFRQSSVMSDG
jgi:hypothetical protein